MKSRWSAFRALIAVFFAALSSVSANAAALETDLAIETLVWSNRFPATMVGSPALSADSAALYVATASRWFYAIDTASGEELWSVKLRAAATSSPVVDDDGNIYVGCANGVVYKITEDDEFVGQIDPLFHPFVGGRVSAPAVDDDGNIYAGTTGNHLFALRPDSSRIWVYNSSNDVRVPVLADDNIFIVSGGFVLGIAYEDGVEVSVFTPRAAINSTPALGDDGTLYFGANDERVYALDPGGTTNQWRFNTQKNVMSSPAIGADGSIYIASDNLRLYRFNSNGVPTVWTNRVFTRAPIRSAISLGADGTVYAGAEDGRMYAFAAETGEVLWSLKTRAPIRSSAVIDSRGVVYFASGRSLYAVAMNLTEDTGEPAWQMFRKDRKHTARATFSLQITNAPIITRQPTNLTVAVGDTASFSVRVQSASPVQYQWYFNSNAISSLTNLTATNATLTISNVAPTNAGFYFVIATNLAGSVTSSVARLTVTSTNGAPRIDQAPTNQTSATGATVNFTVMASGAQPLSYQWRFNAQPIAPSLNPTATNTTLTLTNVTQGNGGFYDVIVTNSLGIVTSAPPAELIVTTNVAVVTNAVVITQHPTSLVVGEGTFASFFLAATGSPPPSFQWYFSSNAISSAGNPTAVSSNLQLFNVQGSSAGFYFAIASNVAGAVTSAVASLTVTNATTVWLPTQTNGNGTPLSNAPPVIVQQPASQTNRVGTNVTFNVVAIGAQPLFYRWYVNFGAVDPSTNSTATNATFTLSNVPAQRLVFVVVSNSFGAVTSSNAVVTTTNSGGIGPGFAAAQALELRLGAVLSNPDGIVIDVFGASSGRLILEYKNSLEDSEWKPLSTNNAGALKLIDPAPAASASRYYRVRLEP